MADGEEIAQQLSRMTQENLMLRTELQRLSKACEENRLLSEPEKLRSESQTEPCCSGETTEIQTEQVFKHLLRETPFGICFWNEQLQCTYSSVNNEADSHFLSKELVERDFVGLFPEASSLVALKESVLSGGSCGAQRKEFKVENLGSLLVVCAPFCCENGTKGVLTISVDNTSQVAMQERLAQVNSEMERWERTEQILRQAIKSADEAMEAKNTFLAVMSHEIRTPLNGVLGMAQVLATTALDTEQKELVDAMVFSGDVLLAIISDILDLSKVESGTMKLEEREYKPRSIVKHVVQTAGAAAKERKIALEMDIAENVPITVIGDPLRLKQVITNLVFNAVKFTKEGHVRVYLRLVEETKSIMKRSAITRQKSHEKKEIFGLEKRPQSDESSSSSSRREESERALEAIPEDLTMEYKSRKETQWNKFLILEFAVEDTGIGIPDEAFPHLFEKFTQVHSSTTRKYGGTGLGLAICKQLVELMGGKITVSSRVGEGSTFTFTISCAPAKKQQQQQEEEEQQKQQRRVSPAALEKTTSYTTAQFHRLQAEFSCTAMPRPGIQSVLSCPLPMLLDKRTMAYLPGKEMAVDKLSRTALRRTSSGPARIELSNIGDTKRESLAKEEQLKPQLLLAEDNKVNVMVAMSMLKRLGYTADVVFNGQEALRAIQTKSYDLVLMDVCMPVLDGLEVTRRVRSFERSGRWDGDEAGGSSESSGAKQHHRRDGELVHLPIVAITANALSNCEEQCLEFGMDGFLTKPVTFKKLSSVLQLFIGGKEKAKKTSSDDLEIQEKTPQSLRVELPGGDAEMTSLSPSIDTPGNVFSPRKPGVLQSQRRGRECTGYRLES